MQQDERFNWTVSIIENRNNCLVNITANNSKQKRRRTWCGHLYPVEGSASGQLSLIKVNASALINSENTANSGRCMDICAQNIFVLNHKFINSITSQIEVHL